MASKSIKTKSKSKFEALKQKGMSKTMSKTRAAKVSIAGKNSSRKGGRSKK